jgi:hypothetical protein
VDNRGLIKGGEKMHDVRLDKKKHLSPTRLPPTPTQWSRANKFQQSWQEQVPMDGLSIFGSNEEGRRDNIINHRIRPTNES